MLIYNRNKYTKEEMNNSEIINKIDINEFDKILNFYNKEKDKMSKLNNDIKYVGTTGIIKIYNLDEGINEIKENMDKDLLSKILYYDSDEDKVHVFEEYSLDSILYPLIQQTAHIIEDNLTPINIDQDNRYQYLKHGAEDMYLATMMVLNQLEKEIINLKEYSNQQEVEEDYNM